MARITTDDFTNAEVQNYEKVNGDYFIKVIPSDSNGNFVDNPILTQVANASDNVTVVNYTDSTKATVSSVVQTSASVGYTVTEAFTSGTTTLTITRTVA